MRHYAYVVKWRDSATRRGWQVGNSVLFTVSTITSVGWLVRHDKTSVCLTTSISDEGSMVDVITIPREAVTKMYRLKQYVQGD